ncbi:MAG: hypothetical protein WCV67_19925 [Victivallaceae bacterium]|jgi:hypothetical protein
MKKLLISAIILASALGMPLQAADAADKTGKDPLNEWTFFQLGFWFDVPSYTRNSNVYFLKLGCPTSSGIGRVKGNELAIFWAGTDYVEGLQSSFIVCEDRRMDGVQAALGFCRSRENLNGLQACGGVNMSETTNGFQPGGVNIAGDVNGLQMAAITNISKDINGAQFSIVNFSKKLNGFQASAVNMADGGDGVQLGAVNITNKRGIQFGLVNYIKDGWVPFLPILNISFK